MRIETRYLVMGLGAAAVFGLLLVSGHSIRPVLAKSGETAQAAAESLKPLAAVPGVFKGEIVLGSPDAPVNIVEYASMTCPHCANFHTVLLPKIKEKYIDTGKLKLTFREFPLDALAVRASMMARCGGEKKVNGFIDVLFSQQQNWATAPDPMAALSRIARMGGMSQAVFDACMVNEDLMKQVVQSRQDGSEKHEIKSTPSFIIDGKTYPGDMDIEEFIKLIDPLIPDA